MNCSTTEAGQIKTPRPATRTRSRNEPGQTFDLRRQIPECELLRLALLATASQVSPAFSAGVVGCVHPLPAANLASLLAFAYSTGRIASEDIVAECQKTPVMNYLAMGRPMEWTELRRFRRQHRGLVVACLAELLRLVRDQHRRCDHVAEDTAALSNPEITAQQLVQQAILADLATIDL